MTDRDAMAREIDTLAERIDARLREFRSNGRFAHLQDKFDWFTERQQRLRGKVNAVADDAWNETHDALAREHGALYDDFLKFEQDLEAEAMREHPRERAPGARSGLV